MDRNNNKLIKWYGRTSEKEGIIYLYNVVSGFTIYAKGIVTIKIFAEKYDDAVLVPYVKLVIDEDFSKQTQYKLDKEDNIIKVDLGDSYHLLSLYKQNEAIRNHIGIVSIDAKCIELPKIYEHTVEVIGDSTIAGFGNLGKVEDGCTTTNTDGLLDYTFKALKELKSEVHTFCASGWGVFGSIWTTPKDIKITDFKDKVCVFSDIPWDYNKINPELIIISLGTNDYYYIQEIEELKEQRRMSFIKEYVDFINYKLACYPNAKVLMCYGCMKEVNQYDNIREVYKYFENNDRVYIKEFAGDCLGVSGHPSVKSHEEMANILKQEIIKIMNW